MFRAVGRRGRTITSGLRLFARAATAAVTVVLVGMPTTAAFAGAGTPARASAPAPTAGAASAEVVTAPPAAEVVVAPPAAVAEVPTAGAAAAAAPSGRPQTARIEAAPAGGPTNVRVTSTASGSADIAWDAADFGAVAAQNQLYDVLVDSAVFPACAATSGTTCHVTGAPGAAVAIVVRALGDDPNSEYVDSTPAVNTTLLAPPTQPADIRETTSASGSGTITWAASNFNGSVNQKYTVLVGGTPFGACTNIAATTCTITGTVSIKTIIVRAIGDTGLSTDSAPVQITLKPPPDPPTNVHVTGVTDGEATIAWTAPASWRLSTNKKYDVVVDGSVLGTCDDQSGTTCVIAGTVGAHTVVVRALGDPGLTRDSGQISINISGVPGPPVNIRATNSDAGSATVVWDAPNWQGNTNRKYTVKVDGVNVPSCVEIVATQCDIVADDLEVDVIVTAIGDDAASQSTASQTTVLALLPAPGPPTNIHPTAWASGSTTIVWDAPNWQGATNNTYTVLVGGNAVGTCTNISAATCVLTGPADTTVSVVVRAIGDPGLYTDSQAVDIALAGVPDAPTAVHVTTKTFGSTRIEWTAPDSWRRNIQRRYTVSVTGTATGCTNVTVTYCVVTGGEGTTTNVTVRAIGDADALGANAGPLAVNIPNVPGVPTDIHATASSSGAADIVWTAPSWNNNVNQTYVVTVDGVAATCADNTATACHITANPGSTVVKVKAVGDDLATLSAESGPINIAVVPVPSGGAVTGLAVDAPPGAGQVNVTWDQLPADRWNGGASKQYAVTIDKPDGSTLNPNTCTTVPDAAQPSCSFTTNTAGTYTVHVKAVNEAGPSTEQADRAGHVTLIAPTGAVTGLDVATSVGSGVVNVTWDQLGAPAWNDGVTKEYAVTITAPDGATLNPNTCTTVADALAPSCSFTTNRGGDYTVRVTARNEAGLSGANVELMRHVTIGAPSGQVAGLNVATVADSGVVNVTWTQLPSADWNAGNTKEYVVTITKPDGATLNPNTCTTVTDGLTPSCSFTTDTSGAYTVNVRAQNEVGPAAADSADSGTVALDEPTGQVAGLQVATTLGSQNVTVTWSALTPSGWNAAATHEYVVTVDKPDGATLSANTCTTVADSAQPGCSFTTDRAGTYTVHVRARNEVGPSSTETTQSGNVILGPSGAVTNLAVHTVNGSGIVTVDWTRLADSGWNNSVTRTYDITIDKPADAVLGDNTCVSGIVDAPGPVCGFTTTVGGLYTVHVRARNEVGAGVSEATDDDTVVLVPVGQVAGLTVTPTPGSGVVNVSWNQLGASGWNGGTTKNYVVTVTKPDGATLNPNTCTTVADAAQPSCSFTTNTAGDYSVRVKANNDAGLSTDLADRAAHVTLVAPTGPVANLLVTSTPGTGVVNVSWNQLAGANWNDSVTKNYVVTIDKPAEATLSSNTCANAVADAAQPSCSFTTSVGGDYTVHVKPNNEVGPASQDADEQLRVVLAVPTGGVTGLGTVALPGVSQITVVWQTLSPAAWNAGQTKEYLVTVDKPDGATLSNSTCGTVVDSAHPMCSFTTDKGGDYTVHVKPNNEAGPSVTDTMRTAHLTLTAPSGQVANLAVATSAGSGVVNVSWNPLSPAGWNAGVTKNYVVTIDTPAGAALNPNTCSGPVADSLQPSCSFTTNTAGDYTVHVKANNEVGPSADVADRAGHVTLIAPSGPVTQLAAGTTAGSGVVNVTWTQLPGANWNAGATMNYVVTIDKPDGAVLNPNTCSAPVADSAQPSCSFTTNTAGDYTVHVKPNNDVGPGADATVQAHVTLAIPSGAVTNLVVTPTPGSGVVNVSWNRLGPSGWNGGTTKNYLVTVTKPDAATLNPNTCTTVADVEYPTCTFTTDTAGDYTVQVRARNEVGPSTDPANQTGHVTLVAPSGSVTGLHVGTSVGSGVVNVTWDQLSPASWNAGQRKEYVVTIDKPDGAVLNPNTCAAVVVDSATPSCTFTTTRGGDYTVHVKPNNEVGPGAEATAQGHVTLGAPSGSVVDLLVGTSAGSGVVTVSWDQLPAGEWAGGGLREYVVTVDKPDGAVLDPNTCGTVADSLQPSCTFTTDTAGAYTVRVRANNEVGPGPEATEQGHVTLVAPSGSVTDLLVGTSAGSGVVNVTWAPLPAGNWSEGSQREYLVTIDKPDGAVLDPNDCATVADSEEPSCTFTTDTGGDYTVHVRANNEVGPGPEATEQGHVTLVAPSGSVTDLLVGTSAGSGVVTVSWAQLPAGSWSEGSQREYLVTIDKPDGAVLDPNDCATVADSEEPSCTFTTDTAGDYTVHVVANNEVGPGAEATAQGHVTLGAPSGSVTGLAVDTTIGSGLVNVSWDQLPAGSWSEGSQRQYQVTIDAPDGAVLSDNDCATVADSEEPSCTFTTDTTGDYIVHVTAVNEAGASDDVADASATVTITALPSGAPSSVTVVQTGGSRLVTVTWPSSDTFEWGTGEDHRWSVSVQPDTVTDNECAEPVADSPDGDGNVSCTFRATDGGTYTVTVRATTSAGSSEDATDGEVLVELGAPASPTAVGGTSGTNSLSVSWTAPDEDQQGAGITGYTVTATTANYPTRSCADDVTSSPCVISELAAGVAYTLHVVATGPGGSSDEATGTPSAPPGGMPMPPEAMPDSPVPAGSGTAARGGPVAITGQGFKPGSTVVLAWYPDVAVLGTATVSSSGGFSATVTVPAGAETGAHPLLATGLAHNGNVRYLAKVVTVLMPVPPSGTVSSLAARQAAQGSRLVNVTWTAPKVNWGNGVGRGYTVLVTGPDGAEVTGTCTSPVTGLSCSFTGDANGAYRVTVTPHTEAGPSATPPAPVTVNVTTAPATPTGVRGTSGVNSTSVSWTPPPAKSVGAGITGYTVTASAANYPTRSCAGAVTRSPCLISGLAAGVAYTLRVVANGPGGSSGVASGTLAKPPTGTPVAPDAPPGSPVSAGAVTVAAGAQVSIAATGFKPGSTVVLALYPGAVAQTTTTASSSGAISATVTVPPGTAAGAHPLLATGLAPNGNVRYVAKAVTVEAFGAGLGTGSEPDAEPQPGAGTGTGTSSPPDMSARGGTGELPAAVVPAARAAGNTGTSARRSTGRLAVTGPNLALLTVSGLVMLTAGLVLATRTYRRPARRSRRHAAGR